MSFETVKLLFTVGPSVLLVIVTIYGLFFYLPRRMIMPRQVRIGSIFSIHFQSSNLRDADFGPSAREWQEPFLFQYDGKLWDQTPDRLDLSRGVALFWVAHDLLWTAMALEADQPAKQIRRGIVMAAWQLEQCGLANHSVYRRLKQAAESTDENQNFWSDEQRHKFAIDLVRDAHNLGEYLNEQVRERGPKMTYIPLPHTPFKSKIVAPYM